MRRPLSGKRARNARVTSGCRAEWAGTAVAVATMVVLAMVRMAREAKARGAISHKAEDHGASTWLARPVGRGKLGW